MAGSQRLSFGGVCRLRMIHQHLWGNKNQTVPTSLVLHNCRRVIQCLTFRDSVEPCHCHTPPSAQCGACYLFSPIILGAVHGQVSCKSSGEADAFCNQPTLRALQITPIGAVRILCLLTCVNAIKKLGPK